MAPLPGFTDDDVVAHGRCHRIYRRGGVLALKLFGEIGDDDSDAWRTAAAAELERSPARFAIFDALEAVPMNSFASRMRTVVFARKVAAGLERILARGDNEARYALIGKVLLQAAKLANVAHEEDAVRFAEKVVRMCSPA